jgi:hypothetical protein
MSHAGLAGMEKPSGDQAGTLQTPCRAATGADTVPPGECTSGWLTADAPWDRGRVVDLVRCREPSTIKQPGMATKITVALEDDLDGGPADDSAIRGRRHSL